MIKPWVFVRLWALIKVYTGRVCRPQVDFSCALPGLCQVLQHALLATAPRGSQVRLCSKMSLSRNFMMGDGLRRRCTVDERSFLLLVQEVLRHHRDLSAFQAALAQPGAVL